MLRRRWFVALFQLLWALVAFDAGAEQCPESPWVGSDDWGSGCVAQLSSAKAVEPGGTLDVTVQVNLGGACGGAAKVWVSHAVAAVVDSGAAIAGEADALYDFCFDGPGPNPDAPNSGTVVTLYDSNVHQLEFEIDPSVRAPQCVDEVPNTCAGGGQPRLDGPAVVVDSGAIGPWTQVRMFQITSEPSTIVLETSSAEITLPQNSGGTKLELDQAFVTAYGRTYVPFRARVLDADDQPKEGVAVTAETAQAGCGISLNGTGTGSPTGEFVSGEDGWTPQAWFVADRLFEHGTLPATVQLSVSTKDDEATKAFDVNDNYASLIASYEATIPVGAYSEGREQAVNEAIDGGIIGNVFLQLFAFPNINFNGGTVCSTYQAKVLTFLNELRHDDANAWILNGFDYGPAMVMGGGHFVTVLWPAGGDWGGKDTVILDPWPVQKARAFTIDEWSLLFLSPHLDTVTFDMPSPPYPNYPTHDPYPASGPGVDGFVGLGQVNLTVVIQSPAEILITTAEGQRVGYESPDYVNELDEPGRYQVLRLPEQDGSRAILMDLEERAVSAELIGLSDGEVAFDVLLRDQSEHWWLASYGQVAIAEGERVAFELDANNRCLAGQRGDGSSVPAVASCPQAIDSDGVPLQQTSATEPSGCACRVGERGRARWPWGIAAAAAAAFVRRRVKA